MANEYEKAEEEFARIFFSLESMVWGTTLL